MFLKYEKLFFLKQYIKYIKAINEIDKSLKKGPVIKKIGIKQNKVTGKLKNISFSVKELNFINYILKTFVNYLPYYN